jgi:hypothetical protein
MKNTNNKHTPGPWAATGHDGKQSIVIETEWGSVAKALSIGAQDQESANAHLIAASPELLQVARDFLLLAALHDWDGAAIDFARATVAKAEGMK